MPTHSEEHLDVLTKEGHLTGLSKPRSLIHKDGDYHRAVHVWIYAESTGELLLQRRADCKDSWPGQWDISSAGHISAGDTSLITARRELEEELGITLPDEAFEFLFVFLQECVINDGTFINNEYNDVYLVTTLEPIPLEAFSLQESEVSEVKYISWREYRDILQTEDASYVPYDVDGTYGQLFSILHERYKQNIEEKSLRIQEKVLQYAPTNFTPELSGLSEGDKKALPLIIQAAILLDCIFHEQVWPTNLDLKNWLEEHSNDSDLDQLKLSYYRINKSPWSCLDDNEAFLSTADSAVKLAKGAVKSVSGWAGLRYRAAFPQKKPPGANFYPQDMSRKEFELWKSRLPKDEQDLAVGYFTVIRRPSVQSPTSLQIEKNPALDGLSSFNSLQFPKLVYVPYSVEYAHYLKDAAAFLHKAGEIADTPSLKRLLKSKGDAFLSNDYYDSDVAWMELDSQLDVTIGPYETYEDALFGYKASFEAVIGIRDGHATSQIKLFSDHLQDLEDNLPLDQIYKSKNVKASPLRVIQLVYSSGDVKGPQTVAFNLPNDERIVKEKGSAMVMLKSTSEAKFRFILQRISDICISEEQRQLVDFESFFTHTVCHECCHGIGPHNVFFPDGKESTVRLELQQVHSAIEEAKADIVGLWALHHLVNKGFLSQNLAKSMYVSFLAGCFRSVRFGLEEAHGKGQALQFNWLLEKKAFVMHSNGTFSVDFGQVKAAVECLSREIMTIQAQGDKHAAKSLLETYAVMSEPLKKALSHLETIHVPIDINPSFSIIA
eukprot:TRINITY_DN3977_c0_g1_i1.p1 TRINITY_DN3977_c0_g1~~TRINITY_DN3977_c0_g1_i1.p1  ORF type:complete len:777 (+),score=147.62 TRINITY_DN3977_c0_g1_i1:111-2441(+)